MPLPGAVLKHPCLNHPGAGEFRRKVLNRKRTRQDKMEESRNRNCRAFVSFWRLSDAPASLFHICRWSAARAFDRCVICRSRHADAPCPRRVKAGHSNCFRPGSGAAARRYRYKPADGSERGCFAGRAEGATPAGSRSDGAAHPAAARGRHSAACNGHQDRTQEDQDRKASRPPAGGGVSSAVSAVSAVPLDLVGQSPFRFADDAAIHRSAVVAARVASPGLSASRTGRPLVSTSA